MRTRRDEISQVFGKSAHLDLIQVACSVVLPKMRAYARFFVFYNMATPGCGTIHEYMGALLTLFFSSFTILAVAHMLGLEYFLYWQLPWFDIPMHFLGGAVIAFGVAILPFIRIHIFDRYTSFIPTLIAVLSIGVAWEIFEAMLGIAATMDEYIIDTTADLVLDVLGGYIGYRVVTSIKEIA